MPHSSIPPIALAVGSWRWVQLYYDPSSPTAGAENADVTVVIVLDHACAKCRASYRQLLDLLVADQKVSVIFKELPSSSPNSDFAARAALAAHKQDMHLALYKEMVSAPPSSGDDVVMMASKIAHIDLEKLRADMGDPAVSAVIDQNRELAGALGITSPAYVIGNRLYAGWASAEELRAAINLARQQRAP